MWDKVGFKIEQDYPMVDHIQKRLLGGKIRLSLILVELPFHHDSMWDKTVQKPIIVRKKILPF